MTLGRRGCSIKDDQASVVAHTINKTLRRQRPCLKPTYSNFICIALINTLDRKQHREKIILLDYNSKLQSIALGMSKPNLKWVFTSHPQSGAKRRNTYVLACSQVALSSLLLFWSPCLGNASTHGELGLPISITNQDSPWQACSQTNLIYINSSLR